MNIESFRTAILNLQPIDLLAYQEVIPEFQILAATEQGKEHHAEGNVLIHSNMAMQQVLLLLDEVNSQEDKITLYVATMLHDIGKGVTSAFNEKKKKITAYGHDKAGVPIANEFLKKYFPEFSYKQREQILRLIDHHMEPRLWMQREDGTTINKMKMLSLSVNTKLLYLLSQADTLGRTAADMKSGMFFLELFRQNCQDLGIWDKAYRVPLATSLDNASYSLARWNILVNEAKEDLDTYDEARAIMAKAIPPFQLMLMVGAPGSGKSSYVKQVIEKYPNVKVISMDERRKELTGDVNDQSRNQEVFNWQEKELRKAMEAKQSTIIDATNPTIKLRKHLFDLGRQNGALCSAVYFDLKLEIILERNANREKRVPDDVVKRFYNSQQSIRPWEADQITIVSDPKE